MEEHVHTLRIGKNEIIYFWGFLYTYLNFYFYRSYFKSPKIAFPLHRIRTI